LRHINAVHRFGEPPRMAAGHCTLRAVALYESVLSEQNKAMLPCNLQIRTIINPVSCLCTSINCARHQLGHDRNGISLLKWLPCCGLMSSSSHAGDGLLLS
jgi:hypothetical protein